MNEIRNVVSSSNLIGVIKRNAFNNKTLKLRNVVNKFLRFECLSFVNQNLMKILIIRTNLSFGKNPIYKFRQNFIKQSSTTSKLIKWHDILKFNLKKMYLFVFMPATINAIPRSFLFNLQLNTR